MAIHPCRTFLGYGALDDTQTGQALESNTKLSKTMAEMYGPPLKKRKKTEFRKTAKIAESHLAQ